jgi:hypothetical protein
VASRKKADRQGPAQGVFDSLVVWVAWCVWLERNNRVFRGTVKSTDSVACVAWEMLQVWCQAGIVVGSMLLRE